MCFDMDEHTLSKIPLDAIEQQIKDITVLNRQRVPIEALKQKLSKLMQGYSCITMSLNAPYVFRARKTKPEKFFGQVSELWYPPADRISRYGRLNNIGLSIRRY